MAPTLERRVEVLEEKMEHVETNAGPGRADAHADNLSELRQQFAQFGAVQAQQAQSLDVLNGKFTGIERVTGDCQFRLLTLDTSLRGFKNEVSGKLDRLDHNFAWLKGEFTSDEGLLVGLSSEMAELRDDVTVIRTDVTALKSDMAEVKSDVAELKTDVTALKSDMAEVKSDVAELKTDVTALKSDMAEVKADVAELKDNVTVLEVKVDKLQADMSEVKGSLKEILDRLPAKAA